MGQEARTNTSLGRVGVQSAPIGLALARGLKRVLMMSDVVGAASRGSWPPLRCQLIFVLQKLANSEIAGEMVNPVRRMTQTLCARLCVLFLKLVNYMV